MKKIAGICGMVLCAFLFVPVSSMQGLAADETIHTGIMADGIDLSGRTQEEAEAAVVSYVEELGGIELTFLAAGGKEVSVTAAELGMSWANQDLVQEAYAMGRKGNVIERYKLLKDLEQESVSLPVRLDFSVENINAFLVDKCVKYDNKPIKVSLRRTEEGEFEVVEGKAGCVMDVEASIDRVYQFLTEEWGKDAATVELVLETVPAQGSAEELAFVKDMIGSCTTSYRTSGVSRSANVENGANLINGTVLYPGEEFSTYETVAPFTQANGYYMAGSYVNGKVVDSLGGGICQVSTTLYNAVLAAELEVTERHNHSMIVSYVDPSADAAIAESSGKDFKFVNNLDYPVYIEGITENKKITVNIYGLETRDENRKVSYESEVLEVIHPTADNIYADAGQPIGYIVTQSAHIGYKARLWKVVTENGTEISREQINSSNYKVSPRSATVGTATADPNAYNEIMAAIGTANIDHVKNVISMLTVPKAAESDE